MIWLILSRVIFFLFAGYEFTKCVKPRPKVAEEIKGFLDFLEEHSQQPCSACRFHCEPGLMCRKGGFAEGHFNFRGGARFVFLNKTAYKKALAIVRSRFPDVDFEEHTIDSDYE